MLLGVGSKTWPTLAGLGCLMYEVLWTAECSLLLRRHNRVRGESADALKEGSSGSG
jgi:hypothetical protein